MSGPREEDGDYAREFFDGYEREADRVVPISSATWAALEQGKAERERDEARAALDRVRTLHSSPEGCWECMEKECGTIRAIDGGRIP